MHLILISDTYGMFANLEIYQQRPTGLMMNQTPNKMK